MKESISSTWMFQLMFGFILLFVSFLTVTISYSKAFRVRNEITSIIEKYSGYNSSSSRIVNNYIKSIGYTNKGNCGDGDNIIGVDNLDSTASAPNKSSYSPNKKYYYCIRKESVPSTNNSVSNTYYEVILFYKFDIPVVGEIATFKIKGKTSDLTVKNDLFN